jgi:uncharacterized membrane protein
MIIMKFRKRRGLAMEIMGALAVLIAVGLIFMILTPAWNLLITVIQTSFGAYIDPNLLNTLRAIMVLAALAVIFSLVAYIVRAGMRRDIRDEFA